MSCRVVLVQHGEKVGAPGDPGLTGRGRTSVGACARSLARSQWDGLWCSDLRRSIETAEIIGAAVGLVPAVDARLRERMNWEGGTFAEFLAAWEAGAATLGAAVAAAHREVLDDVAASCERAIVVAHGSATLDLVRSLGATRSSDG